jgi:DNA-directed RNA polymerase specialized sigma24 family protein
MSTTPMTAKQMTRDGCKILYSPPLRGFARKLVGDDADDVLQDAGLKLVRIIETGTVPRSMQAIVFLLVKHAAFNHLQARKRNAAAPGFVDVVTGGDSVDEHVIQLEDHRAAGERDLAHGVDMERAARLLWEGMEMIPPQYAAQLCQTYVDEEPVRGRVVPFGTAVSRSARAKDWLRGLDCVERAGRLAGVG